MALINDLPANEKDFAKIIDNKMIYVDKTDLIADLARLRGPFFLSRPRGFGKTLLATTLKELFLHGRGRFAGLKLEKEGLWDDPLLYKVIHLNCARIGAGQGSFAKDFADALKDAFFLAGVPFVEEADSWKSSLILSLAGCKARSLILLIDDYDRPLTQALDSPAEFKNRRIVLADFYQIIKGSVAKLRFTFITGVEGFHAFDVMADNIADVSSSLKYGAIAGFTQAELEQNFMPYIVRAAKVLNEKEPQERWDEQKVLAALKHRCGGCSFEGRMKHPGYNPRTAVDFLARPDEGFKNKAGAGT